MPKLFLYLFLFGFMSTTSYAEKHHEHEAHVHGLVEMTLVADGKTVEVAIESPLMNLVGFEHQAQTPQEHEALAAAELFFKKPDQWLQFKTAKCKLIHTNVVLGHDDAKSEHNDLDASYQYQCDKSTITAVNINLQQHFSGIEKIDLNWLVNGQAGTNTLANGKMRATFN